MLKFLWNGIRYKGVFYPASYSMAGYTNYDAGTITIYGKRYKSLPAVDGLNTENNSDFGSDYIENDRVRVEPDNIHYPEVLEAYEKRQVHYDKQQAKSIEKAIARSLIREATR